MYRFDSMKTRIDEHDARKAAIEDRMIETAELKAQEAEKIEAAAKAAHEFIMRHGVVCVGNLRYDSANTFIKNERRALAKAVLAAVKADKGNVEAF